MALEGGPWNFSFLKIHIDNCLLHHWPISREDKRISICSSTYWMHRPIPCFQTQRGDHRGSWMLLNGFMQCFFKKTVDREIERDVLSDWLEKSEIRDCCKDSGCLQLSQHEGSAWQMWRNFMGVYQRWGVKLLAVDKTSIWSNFFSDNGLQSRDSLKRLFESH